MTDPSHQPIKPASTSSVLTRRRTVGFLAVLFMVAGVVGLLVSLGGFSCSGHDKNTASPLRGNNNAAFCPTTVPMLDPHGQTVENASNNNTPQEAPSCASAEDPQPGRYWEWKAPANGQVTLRAWTVLVTVGCDCVTSTPTVDVTANQVLRVWTRNDETKPLVFQANGQEAACPTTVPTLEAEGTVKKQDLEAAVATPNPPTCASAQDPTPGVYYDWTAPSNGKATLAAWTVLANPATCDCVTTTSTFDVTAGHVYRVWTPLEEAQPIQAEFDANQCPETAPMLQDNGSVDVTEQGDMETHMSPSCASQNDPMQGVYFDWQAPAAGHVRLAPWTVLVDRVSCDCLTTVSTFDVVANEMYRIWAPTEEVQPVKFVE